MKKILPINHFCLDLVFILHDFRCIGLGFSFRFRFFDLNHPTRSGPHKADIRRPRSPAHHLANLAFVTGRFGKCRTFVNIWFIWNERRENSLNDWIHWFDAKKTRGIITHSRDQSTFPDRNFSNLYFFIWSRYFLWKKYRSCAKISKKCPGSI